MFGRRKRATAAGQTLASRLTADEAIIIARDAIDDPIISPAMTGALASERDGRIIWIVSAIMIGASPTIEIDDATGSVLARYTLGVR